MNTKSGVCLALLQQRLTDFYKKYILRKRLLKFLGSLLLIILVLIIILYVVIQVPSVQNYAKSKVLSSLSDRYDAKWTIDDIHLDFLDEVTANGILFLDQQNDTLLAADKLQIDIGLFSLLGKEIDIDEINISGGISRIYELENGEMNFAFLNKPNEKPKENTQADKATDAPTWSIHIDDIIANDMDLAYQTATQDLKFKNENLEIYIDKIDLDQQEISTSLIKFSNTNIAFTNESVASSTEPFSLPDIRWTIVSDQIEINKSNVLYADQTNTHNVENIDIDIQDVNFANKSLELNLKQAKLRYNDTLDINNSAAKINLINDQLELSDVVLNTPNDKVRLANATYNFFSGDVTAQRSDIHIDYKTLRAIKEIIPESISIKKGTDLTLVATNISYINFNLSGKNIRLDYGKTINLNTDVNQLSFREDGNIDLDVDLRKLSFDIKEMGQILTTVSIPDSLKRYERINLNGKVTGNLNDLQVRKLEFEMDDAVDAMFTGNILHLLGQKPIALNVNIERLASQISKLPLPKIEFLALDSLGQLAYTGSINGTLSRLTMDGKFTTDIGNLSADIVLQIPDSISNISYKGDVDLDQFDIGTFLKNDELNTLSLSTTIDGKGLDLENIDTDIKGTLRDFEYKEYKYADLNINAHISDSEIDGLIEIDDENVKLQYDGTIKLTEGKSSFDFTANIDTINLKKLRLYNDNLSMSAVVKSKFNLPLNQGENGKVLISDLNLNNTLEHFYADTVKLDASKNNDSTYIDIRSDFLVMDVDGQYKIRETPLAFKKVINQYYPSDSVDTGMSIISDNMKISGELLTLQPIDVLLGKSEILAKKIAVNLESQFTNNALNGKISIDSLYYENNFSERLVITLDTENNALQADINGSNNKLVGADIPILSLTNAIQNGTVKTTLIAKDDDKLPKLKISTSLEKTTDMISLSIEDSLVLNRKDWTASKDNYIHVMGSKIFINNLNLTDTNESLSISSIGEEGNDFRANFNNFNIGQFTTLMTSEPSKLSGEMNGNLELRDYDQEYYYLVDLLVEDIVYDSSAVGQLDINASEKKGSEKVSASFSLTGPQNDVEGEGYYNKKTTETDIDIAINQLEMMLLDPFMSSFMKESKGLLSGNANLKGTADQPLINGSVTLDDVVTTIVANNTSYGIDDHTITFDNSSIDIGAIEIYDAQNNTATLSGKIYHSFLEDINVDIALRTDQFTFLNTKAKDNPVFYGKVIMSGNADITGPIELLDVDVSAQTKNNSEITISPFSATSAILEEDFIKYGKPDDFENLSQQYLLQLSRKFPFRVNLLLDVTKEAKLNMVIDPVTGDKIEGKGTGNLRIKLNPDSSQEIYGQYTVSEGSYSFSYGDFVNKKFTVKPGGTVKFNGNPLNADLDIDAVYSVYTTTYELIKNEVSIDDNEIVSAQRRTNVDVYLTLLGSINEPKILLDIKVPDLEGSNLVSAIDRKLNELRNDPNELNNQVFGLLLFNSFILSESASSGFESFGSNLALSSISSLISNQLNKFADKVIKGVDVDLSVNSYDTNYANQGSAGNVTEIGLQVSKQLFNDRLSISAGGNFDLTGNEVASNYSSFIGDFVLEYKLTDSGRYRVRVFSRSAYDRLLDENSNRNGVSLFFNKQFDSKTDEK